MSRDLTGQTFGRYTVIGFGRLVKRKDKGSTLYWRCVCECGERRLVAHFNLVNGLCKSCGCLSREVSRNRLLKHGQAGRGRRTKEYRAWAAMVKRCENETSSDYGRYGGRGISVCPEWRSSFERFLSDMGAAPSDRHTLDRVDVDGNYEPSNCCWATCIEQANNKRNNRMVEAADGRRMSMADWARVSRVNYWTLRACLDRGMAIEQAIEHCRRLATCVACQAAEVVARVTRRQPTPPPDGPPAF